jgi:PAS domain S-box-containing protein
MPERDGTTTASLEDVLEAARIGFLELSEELTLRHASPIARDLLGISSTGPLALNSLPLDPCVREWIADEVIGQIGAVTSAVTMASGDVVVATAVHHPAQAREGRVFCLLQRPNGPPAQATADLLEMLVDASPDGLSIANASGVMLYRNRRAAQLNGGREDEVLGRSSEELAKAGYFDRSAIMEVISSKSEVTLVQTLRDRTKLLVSGRPIYSREGGVKYVVVVDRDIKEMQRLTTLVDESTKLSELHGTNLRIVEIHGVREDMVVARTQTMRAVRDLALRYAAVDSPVLLLGDSGTGKGLLAKLIHQASARRAGPFLDVNCAAIPEGLLEAELFGYAKGAFTGADPKGKIGLVESAHRGTLVLNEIGDLPLGLQAKLLKFLEDGEIQPIGATRSKKPDVRIIAATSRTLAEMVTDGRFRLDLFYRLNVLPIQIPPLRERREDIAWLIDMMLSKLESKLNKRRKITPAAMTLICQHSFPGNVRELWNLVERLVVTTDREVVDVADLPTEISKQDTSHSQAAVAPDRATLRHKVQAVEAQLLVDALERFGCQASVAKHLGLGQATVSRKMKQYGLAPKGLGRTRKQNPRPGEA